MIPQKRSLHLFEIERCGGLLLEKITYLISMFLYGIKGAKIF